MPPDDTAQSQAVAETSQTPAQRDEVLVALIAQTEQLNERLTQLEDRFDAAMFTSDEVDTDLSDLRLNSARLAEQLSRVTEELQADIDALGPGKPTDQEATAPIDLTDSAPSPDEANNPPPPPDLADSPDTTLRLRRSQGQSGWLPLDD